MLARHAESLFWAGRYLERAEDTARMLDVTYHGLLESPSAEAERAWTDLLEVLNLAEDFVGTGRRLDASDVSDYLVLDEANPSAIVNAVARARENARGVRELISTELWEALNTFFLELRARNLRADIVEQPYELYGLVKRRCQTVTGVASETMPRDDGWRFLTIGRLLERAEMTCRLLNVRYAELAAASALGAFHVLVSILKSASASEAYRKVHGASMNPVDVVDYLLLARNFPRSVLHCLVRAERELQALAGDEVLRPQRLVGRIRSHLEFADAAELAGPSLHMELDRIQIGVREVSDAIGSQYFRNVVVDIQAVEFHPATGF